MTVELTISVDEGIASEWVPDASMIESVANDVLAGEGRSGATIDLRVAAELPMRELNRMFRGADKPTNVLSFPADAPPGCPLPLLGDIAICPAVVSREAEEQNKRYADHFVHMFVHGLLHLLGYDHIEEAEAEVMESREISILARLNISNPYRFALEQ